MVSKARALAAIIALLSLPSSPTMARQSGDLDPVLEKMGQYVAGYGEKASVVVGVEKYTQSINTEQGEPTRPRQLVAEFAIVKASDGWIGFRDVVQVDRTKVADRQDRLARLFTEAAVDVSEMTRIANESARYNVGPVATNLNLPTTALFFFQPQNLRRFTFKKAGVKKIDGVDTVEIAFKETKSPTLIGTRAGRDVPMEGTLWVVPEDGTVVRTRLRLRGFADRTTTKEQEAPRQRPTANPNVQTGGREALAIAAGTPDPFDARDIKSVADIETTYRRDATTGLWLPARMEEQYEGAIKVGAKPPFFGMSTTRATYSEYKQFGAGAQVKIPKAP